LPEVRFIDWESPFLPAVSRHLVDGHACGPTVDLERTLLVTPGSRSGRRLLELLVDLAAEAGLRLIPPRRILTVGALPEELYNPGMLIAPGPFVRRAWAQALNSSPPDVIAAALGPHGPESLSTGQVGLSRMLDTLSRTVGAAGKDFGAVSRECHRGFLFSDETRWAALSRIQVAMRSALRAAGFMDREEVRAEALKRGDIQTDRSVFLLGVAEMPLITRRMLERISDHVTVLVHAPSNASALFDDFGTVRVDGWREFQIPIEDHDLLVMDSPTGQAEVVASTVADLSGDHGLDEITIGVPDQSLVPFLVQRLDSAGYPARYAEGTPVTLSAPVQLLDAVADLLQTGRYSAMANLVRHPDLPAFLDPDRAPDLVDRFFEHHLPALVPSEKTGSGGGDAGFSQLVRRLRTPAFLGQLDGEKALTAWMPLILSFLSDVYGDLENGSDPGRLRAVWEASVQIRDAAEALSSLPDALDATCSAAEAIRVLVGELRDGRLPPEAEEDAVELVGWLELQLDDAPIVLLTGVSDPFLPEAVNADPFLPNALRERLGLEDNNSRYARDAYRLTTLVHSTRSRTVLAGRRTAAGDPLRPSRLLLSGSDEEVARRILSLTGDTGDDDPRFRPETPLRIETRKTRFRLPPEPRIQVTKIPQPLPVTAFKALIEDPYLWALSGILGLRESSFDLQELDPLGFGTLGHAVLERFAAEPEATSTEPAAVERCLSELLDQVVGWTFGPDPIPTIPLQVEQLRLRLSAFAEWQADWAKEGWEILWTEARTPEEGVPFDVDGIPILLSGRVDRIDRHRETGAWMVFDYKTSEDGVDLFSVRGRDGEWKDLQLPLYRFLLPSLRTSDGQQVAMPPSDVSIGLAYLPLSKDPEDMDAVFPHWTEDDLASAEEKARSVIRTLRAEGWVSFQADRTARAARGEFASLMGKGVLSETEEDR